VEHHEIAQSRFRIYAPGIIGVTSVMAPVIGYWLWSDGARVSTAIGCAVMVVILTLGWLYRLRQWELRTTTITVGAVAQRGYEVLWLLPVFAWMLVWMIRR
jgi:hypothetical protein